MCPLPGEMYTPPYYRDIMAAPMGNPYMYGGDLGLGMGLYGGMYPMCGMYGGYIPPQFYGLKMNNRTLSQDTYVPKKDVNAENNNQIKKFFKILGVAVGAAVVGKFCKGKMVAAAKANGAHTFWTKLFNLKVPGLGRPNV